MTELPNLAMTVDEFLVGAETRSGRHELVRGQVYAMAPERVGEVETKYAVQTALEPAIGRARLPCHMLPDGVTVCIDANTAYEPDAQVSCGPQLPRGALEVPEPLIVVEVPSPSTGRYDRCDKLAGYLP